MAFALLTPAAAFAQGADKSTAVALFDEAERLATSGNYADACPKFAESYHLDPQLGALMHLADCYDKNGQLASAWASFRDATEIATQRGDERAALAKQRAADLEGRLSRLSILVPKEVVVPGIDVRRDGSSLGSALWGAAVPVDPGEHRVEVSAPGKQTWKSTVAVGAAGDKASISVPALADASVPEAQLPVTAARESSAPADADTGGAHHISTRTITGIAAVGVGVVGLGLGTVFELKRSSKLNDRDALCPSSSDCPVGTNAQIRSLESDAKSAGTIGAIGLIAGGVLTAGGIALILTAPSDHRGSTAFAPVAAPGLAGAVLRHVF